MHKQTEISEHRTMSLKTGMSYDSGCRVGGLGSFPELCEKVGFGDHYAETAGRCLHSMAAGLFQRALCSVTELQEELGLKKLFSSLYPTPRGAECVAELTLCSSLAEEENEGRTVIHRNILSHHWPQIQRGTCE